MVVEKLVVKILLIVDDANVLQERMFRMHRRRHHHRRHLHHLQEVLEVSKAHIGYAATDHLQRACPFLPGAHHEFRDTLLVRPSPLISVMSLQK